MAAPLANGEADAILQKYRTQAKSGELKFRRWPLRAVGLRISMYKTYSEFEFSSA